MKTDLIIIGSGPGGYRAAAYAAQKGLKVTIIEKEHLGGTCLNSGCIPTKTLCHHAEQPAPHDFAAIMAHKNEVVEQLRAGVEQLMATPGITLLKGEAKYLGNKKVLVTTTDTELTAENVIIATGSSPKMPPIEGIDLPHVLTSTGLLGIDCLPQNLCVVGAGVIGLEMASVFNAFGSKVTVVEFMKECLPAMDADLAKRLRKSMEKDGIAFNMQSAVKKITPTEVVFADKKGKEQSVPADCVLIATGRKPNLESVPNDLVVGNFINVDDNFQTNEPGVYAIGDVNGRCLLAHAATFQGFRAVNHILATKKETLDSQNVVDNIRFDIMPAAVFTQPEVAAVGPTEQQLKEKNVEHRTLKGYYRANGRALANDCTEGLLKLIVDDQDHILACHVLGSHAADIVQEVTVLINLGATLQQLRDIIHTHPTLSEVLHEVSL